MNGPDRHPIRECWPGATPGSRVDEPTPLERPVEVCEPEPWRRVGRDDAVLAERPEDSRRPAEVAIEPEVDPVYPDDARPGGRPVGLDARPFRSWPRRLLDRAVVTLPLYLTAQVTASSQFLPDYSANLAATGSRSPSLHGCRSPATPDPPR